jgi:Heavy metal binding domain
MPRTGRTSTVSAAVVCVVLMLGAGPRTNARAIACRFHHVHVRVPDPAAAINTANAKLQGARTLLRGHGAGVRTGGQYVIFDRESNEPGVGEDFTPSYQQSRYLEASRWLETRGVSIEPAAFSGTAIAGGVPAFRIDAIAFSVTDLEAAADWLQTKGEAPAIKIDDTLRFQVSPDLAVEIIRETDRPDAFWCPMHLDVRSSSAGICPICGMDLVPIPPPKIGSYRLDVAITPARNKNGGSRIRLTVREPETNAPVTAFATVHERPLHLFIVSRDLSHFAHEHPAQKADGSFELEYNLPPGEYVLIADFVPLAGTPQIVQRAVVTPGYDGPLFPQLSALTAGAREQVVNGLRVRLEVTSSGILKPARFRFGFSDARTNAPVTDLEPYLGASAHLLIVNDDLSVAIHVHPEGALTPGPEIGFEPLLPTAGAYKLWIQVQRAGTAITVPFVIETT